VTGFSILSPQIATKQLALLKEAIQAAKQVSTL
jgi:hypothetical protein